MNHLAEDLVRHLLHYLTDEEQIQILDCSSRYVLVKKAVRKVTLRAEKLKRCCEDKEYLAKLQSLIEDPGRQLRIIYNPADPFLDAFTELLSLATNNISFIFRTFSITKKLKINTLELTFEDVLEQSDLNTLADMCELGGVDNLFLVTHVRGAGLPSIPYFPNVRSLVVTAGRPRDFTIVLPSLYKHHLKKLVLAGCSDIDVGCLDFIPELTIENCTGVQGVSNLKNNKKIKLFGVTIVSDENLIESFINSEEIAVVMIGSESMKLDLSKWRKVKNLTLYDTDLSNYTKLMRSSLPPTVRRCTLEGSFVAMIDGKLLTHQLSELTLSECEVITSLKGLGLDKIPVLTFYSLSNITSLEGLGGKNQKVTVRYCDKFNDFSAVRSVDTVTIACDGFNDVSQVNEVRVLELWETRALRNLDSLGRKTERLSVFGLELTCADYPALSKIPCLILRSPDMTELVDFLSNGGRFENRVLVISCSYRSDRASQDYCEQYLSSDFHILERKKFQGGCMRLIQKNP